MNQMDKGQVTFFPEKQPQKRKVKRRVGLSSHGQRIADIALRKGYLMGLADGYASATFNFTCAGDDSESAQRIVAQSAFEEAETWVGENIDGLQHMRSECPNDIPYKTALENFLVVTSDTKGERSKN